MGSSHKLYGCFLGYVKGFGSRSLGFQETPEKLHLKGQCNYSSIMCIENQLVNFRNPLTWAMVTLNLEIQRGILGYGR